MHTHRALESSGGFTLMLHELSCGFYRVCIGDTARSIAIAKDRSRQIQSRARAGERKNDYLILGDTPHSISLKLCDDLKVCACVCVRQ
jgi:hypothetical protein